MPRWYIISDRIVSALLIATGLAALALLPAVVSMIIRG